METNMRIADIALRVLHQSIDLRQICRPYLEETPGARMTVAVTPALVESERNRSDQRMVEVGEGHWESLAFCRELCRMALEKETILFHSSAIAVDGGAYLFTAPSGTGKSTHAALWRRLLRERAVMINDDKPFLRRVDGIWYAYGSPWMGKHRLGNPIRAQIRGICLLGRGDENSMVRIDSLSAFPALFAQTQRATGEAEMKHQLALLSDLSEQVPLWRLVCDISEEAAVLSYTAMTGE